MLIQLALSLSITDSMNGYLQLAKQDGAPDCNGTPTAVVAFALRKALFAGRHLEKSNRVHLNPPPHTLPQRRRRMQRRHPHRFIFIRRFNDEEAAHHLLGFGKRPIDHLRLAAARPQGRDSLRAVELGADH